MKDNSMLTVFFKYFICTSVLRQSENALIADHDNTNTKLYKKEMLVYIMIMTLGAMCFLLPIKTTMRPQALTLKGV